MTQYYNSGTQCSDLTLQTFSNVLNIHLKADESVSEPITSPQIFKYLYEFLWRWFYNPSPIQDSYADETVSESITLPQIFEHLYGFLWLWFYDPSAIQDSYADGLFRQVDAQSWLWRSVQHIWITHDEEIPGLDVRDALDSLTENLSTFFYYVAGASDLDKRCVKSIEKVMEKAFELDD
jgi:hypothetical protein